MEAAGASEGPSHRCAGAGSELGGLYPIGQAFRLLPFPPPGLAAAIPPSASTPALLLFQLSAAGDVFHQCLRLQADPGAPSNHGPNSSAPAASWSPQDTACCSQWLKALLEVPTAPPVWAAPTFSHRQLLGCLEQRKVEGRVPEGLRAAMAQGRLLRQRDLGSLPVAQLPPASESGPEDMLTGRLEAAWRGRAAAWWERQQGGGSGPGRPPKRHKRRTLLSSTFSSLSRPDLSDATPAYSPDRTPPEARPCPPVTLPSQEVTQELWTIRNCTTGLLSQRDTLGGSEVPSSQSSGVRAPCSGQRAPVLSGSQPHRKKPRMGF